MEGLFGWGVHKTRVKHNKESNQEQLAGVNK